jgi:hypothetical protein
MFVQNLEKAFLLGLPKAYRSIDHHEMKLKGKIDINQFIKYDIPFQGKVSSVSREQKGIQEIIDVLYKAVKVIDKSKKFSMKNISLSKHISNNIETTIMCQMRPLTNPSIVKHCKILFLHPIKKCLNMHDLSSMVII